jgi:hypothetical protein
LELPPPLEQEFRTEVIEYEKETDMPSVTNIERFGREEGIQQGTLRATRELIKETLLIRFGSLAEEVTKRIDAENDLTKLQAAHRLSVTCKNATEFGSNF